MIYIDRQLTGPYGHDRNRDIRGPWEEGRRNSAIRANRRRDVNRHFGVAFRSKPVSFPDGHLSEYEKS